MFVLYLLIFFLGSALGSFVNMLTYRLPKKESLSGRSYNDFTGKELSNIDLIPVLSFLIFKGKDRTSGKKLPISYPLIELISGISSVVIMFVLVNNTVIDLNLLIQFSIWQVIVFFLVLFGAYDYFNWSLNRKLLVIAILIACIIIIINKYFYDIYFIDGFESNFLAGLYCLLFTLGLMLISKGKGLEVDDALLVAYSGLILGTDSLITLLLFTSISGSIFGIIRMKNSLDKKNEIIQFAPFVSIASVVLMFF